MSFISCQSLVGIFAFGCSLYLVIAYNYYVNHFKELSGYNFMLFERIMQIYIFIILIIFFSASFYIGKIITGDEVNRILNYVKIEL